MKMEDKAATQIALHPFEQWLTERHKWLQTAAARMIKARALPDAAAINNLADLCILEASKQKSDQFEVVATGALAQPTGQASLRLRKISEITGVNAIKHGATLDFGTAGLFVIYGSNGSGKSGYSRLIKQICGSRAKEELLGNVFSKERPEPSARIHLAVGEGEKEGTWKLSDGPVSQLRHVHVFDSTVATLYFGAKNEATYEPSRMRFVSSLIKICDMVSGELTDRKNKLQSKLPRLPEDLAGTSSAKFLATMKAGITAEAIATACSYTKGMNEERISGEATLAEKDIPGRLRVIEREISALNIVKTMVQGWKEVLGDESLANLASVRATAIKKRKAAGEDAEKVFGGSPLEGVGQESWRELWEKAREFSVSHAYKGADFPNTTGDARCVLCQQPLVDEAKVRLTQFEKFVRGELEKDAADAERALNKLEKALPSLPDAKAWIVNTNPIKLEEQTAADWLSALVARRDAANTAVQTDQIPVVDWAALETPITEVSDTLLAEKKALTELLQDGKRKQLVARVQDLIACQWLSREQDAIQSEVQRLNTVATLAKAISLTSTSALTKKNTELADQELKGGYQDRFTKELEALNGARLPVEPKSKQQGKGKVTFSLSVKETGDDVKAESILSEGERRIIALAAFLADISGSGQPTPFVFDDPISSLDQDFEEHVVDRLVALARERQVIIFTHRLSLLTQVESTVKKLRDEAELKKQPAPVDLATISLRRLGQNVGLVADLSIRDAKPDKALNKIRNEAIVQLRKLHDAAEVEEYEQRAKGVCSDIRILVERCVETILLNNVLLRFRRSITTQNLIGKLAKIRSEDCAMIDDLMTRYSVFEHSQSSELPAECPDIEVIERDVDKLIEWIKEFSGRSVK
ncbi:AAA family ATPase [Paraburkholderia caribensis]|uniref:SMC domain protein n=2 Tax=Paraburkholderia TaxID=1822464 RepID=B2JY10_PARP8|nr:MULTISPECIES: AAA family ATPase [Paraburkholderia]ACC76518.1 SMC domain protein [Paraburkholderia phymatum STM815]MCO4880993.1 AAA family ATPase [Paraburkholderia caribensis]PTB25774.1 chromosome segregation protein SMC [Paraburkholderia caribensis]